MLYYVQILYSVISLFFSDVLVDTFVFVAKALTLTPPAQRDGGRARILNPG